MPTDPRPQAPGRTPRRASNRATACVAAACLALVCRHAHAASPAPLDAPSPITPATLAGGTVIYADLPESQPGPGFDQAAIDPAIAQPGDILQTGIASWYGHRWRGRRTASGARFNPDALTAASPTLPLGTRVWVTLEGTARSVLVTITDRQGTAHRIIDLSLAAARRIGMLGQGTARVILRRA
jgi:rare lipoprotein A